MNQSIIALTALVIALTALVTALAVWWRSKRD